MVSQRWEDQHALREPPYHWGDRSFVISEILYDQRRPFHQWEVPGLFALLRSQGAFLGTPPTSAEEWGEQRYVNCIN